MGSHMIDKHKIRKFIQREIIKDGNFKDLTDTDSLIESEIIDSLGIQVLLAYLEETYCIHIEDEELIPENFETVEAIAALIAAKEPR